MPFLKQPLSRAHTWLVSLASAVGGAWVNHTLSAGNNGRLTFMLLYPAVLLGGYLGGAGPAIVAGFIGAAALVTWHPEMADGRTLGELGSVGLFLLICALIARVCDSLHQAETFARNGKASGPGIAEIPLRGPFAPLVVWPVSLLALGVALAVNPEIAAYSGGRLPFVVLLPVMALAGYMGALCRLF